LPAQSDTLRALAETVVPGPPEDSTPGAGSVEAERFLERYLDAALPGLAASVCAMLDQMAADRRRGATFATLHRGDRAAILDRLWEHPMEELRDLAVMLSMLSIAAVYSEWSGTDDDGRLVRRPLGWELTGFPGPRFGVRSLLHREP
jgi:hypothetical protein